MVVAKPINRGVNVKTKQQTTLPESNIAMENPPFWWYLPGKMVILMGELLVSGRVYKVLQKTHADDVGLKFRVSHCFKDLQGLHPLPRLVHCCDHRTEGDHILDGD